MNGGEEKWWIAREGGHVNVLHLAELELQTHAHPEHCKRGPCVLGERGKGRKLDVRRCGGVFLSEMSGSPFPLFYTISRLNPDHFVSSHRRHYCIISASGWCISQMKLVKVRLWDIIHMYSI